MAEPAVDATRRVGVDPHLLGAPVLERLVPNLHPVRRALQSLAALAIVEFQLHAGAAKAERVDWVERRHSPRR